LTLLAPFGRFVDIRGDVYTHVVIHNFLSFFLSYADTVFTGAKDELGGRRTEGH
jgi:hypothetical protein